MMKSDDMMKITVAVFIVLIIGAGIIYSGSYHTNISARDEGSYIYFEIDTNYDTLYSAVSLDNGSTYCEEYVIFYDKTYPVNGGGFFDESVEFLKKELEARGIPVQMVNTDILIDLMTEEIDNDIFTKGVIFLSGTVPEPIYDGTEDSLLVTWLIAGGVLVWSGEPLGKFYSTHDSIETVSEYGNLFFGSNNVQRDGDRRSFTNIPVQDAGFNDKLSIYYNDCQFGIKADALLTQHIITGYENDDGYCSVAIVKMWEGEGSMTIFGGYISRSFTSTVAQVIASGLSYESVILDSVQGTKYDGTLTGHLDKSESGHTIVYIYLGDLNVNIGKRFIFQ